MARPSRDRTSEAIAMPAKSQKQAKFMRACAHHPSHMKGKCPPVAVAREFMHVKKPR